MSGLAVEAANGVLRLPGVEQQIAQGPPRSRIVLVESQREPQGRESLLPATLSRELDTQRMPVLGTVYLRAKEAREARQEIKEQGFDANLRVAGRAEGLAAGRGAPGG
jgi:hypothetical protein